MTHTCVNKITTIGSDNTLSPGRRQAIIWTNTTVFSIRPLGIYFSKISFKIQKFSFTKMHFKMAAILSRPQCALTEFGPMVQLECRNTYFSNVTPGTPTTASRNIWTILFLVLPWTKKKRLSLNFIIKIHCQCHGSKVKVTYRISIMLSIHFLSVPKQTEYPFLRYRYFKIWICITKQSCQGHGWSKNSRS